MLLIEDIQERPKSQNTEGRGDEKYTMTKQTQHMKPPTQRRIATEESPWSA